MPPSLQEILEKKSVRFTFERSIGLIGATTLGVGALMGAGIYVLVGLAAGQAGPSAWLAYLICGLLTIPSVLMFSELSRLVPVAGGGYVYSYQGLGSLGGFVAGWLLAWGSILACAMYSLGFAYYFASLLGISASDLMTRLVAIAITWALTLLNCVGTKRGEKAQRFFTLGNLLILLFLVGAAALQADPARATPLLPNGIQGLAGAVAIIYISFFGYQLIANNAEEIIDPKVTIPRAMLYAMLISLSAYVAVALASVLVVPWPDLAKASAPLAEVAQRSLGSWGLAIVGLGGILASAAALNSTLLSQGRQIYAMGGHNFLPPILGKIHEAYKTPVAALVSGGLCATLTILLANLEFIVKTANFCFITSLLIVAFALRNIQREGKQPLAAFQRFLPWTSLGCNLVLLVTIDWPSLVLGSQLTLFGLLAYFAYSRKRELRSRLGMSLVLAEEKERRWLRTGSRILVPMANPKTQSNIFTISKALLGQKGGEIVVLSVILAPEQVDFHSALSDSGDAVEILERSTRLAHDQSVRVKPVVRVSRSLGKGIIHAAEEESCSLVVMGYGAKRTADAVNVMEEVLAGARTDVIVVKVKGEFPPSRIAVSLGSRQNLELMGNLAGALADNFGGTITFLNILPEHYTAEQKTHSRKILAEAIEKHTGKALFRTEVLSSRDPLETLVERSQDFDLIIAGTGRVGLLEKAVVGSFAAQLVERAHCSVALVRTVPASQRVLIPFT